MKPLSTEYLSLFPTNVWKVQLDPDDTAPINAAVMELLEPRLQAHPLRPGETMQTETDLQSRAATTLKPLTGCVRKAVRSVLEYLKIHYEDFVITGLWVNIGAPGSHHKPHAHPNNFLSGSYYVEAPEGANRIQFHDPRPQTSIIKPPVSEMTPGTTDHVLVTVRPGTLLLFPAWLTHSVPTNESSGRRISVAFNIMFSGYGETMSTPLWQGNLSAPSE